MLFVGIDCAAHADWFRQEVPVRDLGEDLLAVAREVYWKHYSDSRFCSYPSRTGDLRYLDAEQRRSGPSGAHNIGPLYGSAAPTRRTIPWLTGR